MTAHGIDFMERQVRTKKPFYLQMSHYPDQEEKGGRKSAEANAHGDEMILVDKTVGQIPDADPSKNAGTLPGEMKGGKGKKMKEDARQYGSCFRAWTALWNAGGGMEICRWSRWSSEPCERTPPDHRHHSGAPRRARRECSACFRHTLRGASVLRT